MSTLPTPDAAALRRPPGRPLTALDGAVEALKRAVSGLLAVWVFGTWGTEHERPDSDLDLAVLAERPLSADEVWAALRALHEVTDRDVDLVDLTRNDAIIRAQVVARGERLYCADAARCTAFEDFVYSDYARLNEERAGILQDIAVRGRIHA